MSIILIFKLKKVFKNLDYQQYIFIFILFLYGFFSTPTPDKIGLIEVLIGILLVVIFVKDFLILFGEVISPPRNFLIILFILIFLYFFIFCSLYGIVLKQNSLGDFIRDIIPFIYSFIPILLYGKLKGNPNWLYVLIIGMLIAGMGFAFQYWKEANINLGNIIIQQFYGENRDNPWQEPSTIYAFTFFGCFAIYSFLNKKYIKFLIFTIIYLSFFIVYAMTVSRAPIGLSILSMLLIPYLFVPEKKKWKKRLFNIILLFFALLILFYVNYELVLNTFSLLVEKTTKVGIANSRTLEMQAVVDNIKNIPTLLFGEGWGGLIANPIGGGAKWRFVHNMFFYYLFKTGLIGLIIFLIYLIWIFRKTFKILKNINKFPPFLGIGFISIFPPLVVAGTLEASYKTLTFGILLSIVLGYGLNYKRLYNARFI